MCVCCGNSVLVRISLVSYLVSVDILHNFTSRHSFRLSLLTKALGILSKSRLFHKIKSYQTSNAV